MTEPTPFTVHCVPIIRRQEPDQDHARKAHLLALPRELRDEIYFILFNSTRLTSGLRRVPGTSDRIAKWVRPAPNSLANLRACRQTHAEAQHAWLSRLTFCFENSAAFMEKLHTLPDTTVAGIRHMRICDHWMTYRIPRIEVLGTRQPRYMLSTHFRLFPAVRLDCLTIVQGCGCGKEPSTHAVREGTGWRQVRIVTRAGKSRNWAEQCEVKMETCRNLLLQRDGVGSGAMAWLDYGRNGRPASTPSSSTSSSASTTLLHPLKCFLPLPHWTLDLEQERPPTSPH